MLKDLAKRLDALYAQPGNYTEDDGYKIIENIDLIDPELEADINEALCECPAPSYKKIAEMKELGYDVYAGDSDAFGWLTGVIKKHGDERIIVFG